MADRYIRNGDFVDAAQGSWLKVFNQLTYAGNTKFHLYDEFNALFGEENWLPAHWLNGEVISRYDAYLIYEEAYYHFLKRTRPDVRTWLIETASEVYDIQPSNVRSGQDYAIQECSATHLQDISIRRVLTRLALEEQGEVPDIEHLPTIPVFKGNHLVQIRDHTSEGYVLNPGKVPFHDSDLFLATDQSGWWDPGSVEDWYQKNKVLLVDPAHFNVHLDFIVQGKVFFAMNKYASYRAEIEKSALTDIVWFVRGRVARSLYHGDKSAVKVISSPELPFIIWREIFSSIDFKGVNAKRSMRFEDIFISRDTD